MDGWKILHQARNYWDSYETLWKILNNEIIMIMEENHLQTGAGFRNNAQDVEHLKPPEKKKTSIAFGWSITI